MPDRSSKPVSPSAGATASPARRLLLLAAVAVPIVLAVYAVAVVGSGGARPAASASPPAVSSPVTASPSAGSAEPDPSSAASLERADSPTRGPADAPVTLVEFLDPECEACRAFHPYVKQLLVEHPEDVRLVVRYVPGHANSALAIIALEAARAQDEELYWEMLDLLFERQPEWGEQQEPQPQAFLDAAAAVGLDTDPIEAAMAASDATLVERDLDDAIAAGVTGTPTFFVNGTLVTEFSPAGLKAAVDAALER